MTNNEHISLLFKRGVARRTARIEEMTVVDPLKFTYGSFWLRLPRNGIELRNSVGIDFCCDLIIHAQGFGYRIVTERIGNDGLSPVVADDVRISEESLICRPEFVALIGFAVNIRNGSGVNIAGKIAF